MNNDYDYMIKRNNDFCDDRIIIMISTETYKLNNYLYQLFKDSILNDIDEIVITRFHRDIKIVSDRIDITEFVEAYTNKMITNLKQLENSYNMEVSANDK